MQIKKSILAILLVIALGVGGVGGAAIFSAQQPEVTDGKLVSEKEYKEYQYYKESYGYLDYLKTVIKENYYLPVEDENPLMIGAYKGLFAGLGDPYSGYLTKEEYEDLLTTVSGKYDGVGVTMSVSESGHIEVISAADDSPAQKAGIKSGDYIVGVDGIAYNAETMSAAADAIRGKRGTKVVVSILRDGKTKEYSLRRQEIITKTIKSQVLEGNIGYIRISSFAEDTAKDFEEALSAMEVKGVAGVVIDLRDNSGGLVDSSVEIADRLLEAGTIAYTEDNKGNKEYYKSKEGKTQLPYTVLINGGSASASEIVAAGIKDNKGGALVGVKSYGKGIIQATNPLKEGGAIKLTVMQYFSPKGNTIHKVGVEPDYEVELTEEDYTDGVLTNDRQLKKAVELLTKATV